MKRTLQLCSERIDVPVSALPVQKFLSGICRDLRSLRTESSDSCGSGDLTTCAVDCVLNHLSLLTDPPHDVVFFRGEQRIRPDELFSVGEPEEGPLHPQVQVARELNLPVQHPSERHYGIRSTVRRAVKVRLLESRLGSRCLASGGGSGVNSGARLHLGCTRLHLCGTRLLLRGFGGLLRCLESALRSRFGIASSDCLPNGGGGCDSSEDQQADLHREHQGIFHARTLSGVTR